MKRVPDEKALRETIARHSNDVGLQALSTVVKNDLENAKDALVDAAPEQFFELQGQARAYKRILKYLTARVGETPKV